jgi:alpha-L-fucosidase
MFRIIKMQKIIFSFALFFIWSAVWAQEGFNYVSIDSNDTREDILRKAAHVVPTQRQLNWQKMELISFIHFGMNTFTGREWGTGKEDPQMFNPVKLDAEQWVRAIKNAGFKELIITAKHHDGFCLWPTKTTEHCIRNSPWKEGKGDVIKEVASACRKYNIALGIYLSPWDRNSAVYGTDQYNDLFVAQLTELLSNYGKVSEVWFDGANGEGPNGKRQVYDYMRWYAVIRKLQPDAVIAIMGPDVRWVGTESGKGRPTEWSVIPNNNLDQEDIAKRSQQDVIYKPLGDLVTQDLGSRELIYKARGLVWYPAETNTSIRPGWFYHANEDVKVKTPGELMNIYFTSVGMNGVFLLNLPPDTNGLINVNDINSLREFKALLDSTFTKNLASGARLKSSNGKNEISMLDNDYYSYFTTQGADTGSAIEITLTTEQTFNVLLLQENITIGQRVEGFVLEYRGPDNLWIPLVSGTTIGYKRLLKFDTIKAKYLRLKILTARSNPAISAFGLYLLK